MYIQPAGIKCSTLHDHCVFKTLTAVGVISETIRKVTMARSMKNVKTAQVVTLTATHRAITLVDPIAKKSIGQVHTHVDVNSNASLPGYFSLH